MKKFKSLISIRSVRRKSQKFFRPCDTADSSRLTHLRVLGMEKVQDVWFSNSLTSLNLTLSYFHHVRSSARCESEDTSNIAIDFSAILLLSDQKGNLFQVSLIPPEEPRGKFRRIFQLENCNRT